MENKYKIFVMSHFNFELEMEKNGWNDENIDTIEDCAFISIVGKQECLDLMDINEREHYFKLPHSNVLNLEFDDTVKDMVYKGAHIWAMTEEQAKQTVEFIEKNIGKKFYIHCLAGISRSGACGTFIESNYEEYKDTLFEKWKLRPNVDVLAKLNRTLWSKVYEEFKIKLQ